MRYSGKKFPGKLRARLPLAAGPVMLLAAAGMAHAAPPPSSPPPDRKLLEVTLTVVTPDQDINRAVAQTIILAAPHGVAAGIQPVVVAGKSSPDHSGKPAVKTAKKTRASLLRARRETAEAEAEAAEAKSEAREDAHNSTTPDSDDGGGG